MTLRLGIGHLPNGTACRDLVSGKRQRWGLFPNPETVATALSGRPKQVYVTRQPRSPLSWRELAKSRSFHPHDFDVQPLPQQGEQSTSGHHRPMHNHLRTPKQRQIRSLICSQTLR